MKFTQQQIDSYRNCIRESGYAGIVFQITKIGVRIEGIAPGGTEILVELYEK